MTNLLMCFSKVSSKCSFTNISIFIVGAALALTGFWGCSKTETTETTPNVGIVSQKTADDIAKDFFVMYHGQPNNREIEEQTTAIENGVPLFYVYNYKGGGYLVLSADYGQEPVLASNLDNKFPLKGEVNPGLIVWFSWIKQDEERIRQKKIVPEPATIDMWENLKNHTLKAEITHYSKEDILRMGSALKPRTGTPNTGGGRCAIIEEIYYGPLMTTEWDQGCYYNSQITTAGNFCGRAPTGCVATSIAQILKYHDNLNVPDVLTSENYEVAHLMQYCGSLVGMNYGADASGAYTRNIYEVLRANRYAYNSALYDTYDNILHDQEIRFSARPVILDGCTDYSCFLWWCSGSNHCHAWVSDGERKIRTCNGGATFFHMNWGWGGLGPNGYYYIPKPDILFPDGQHYYRYDQHLFSNIHK